MNPSTTAATGDVIDLGEYLSAIWRARLPIAAVAIVSAVTGFGFSISRPPAYEAQLTLAVSQAKYGDQYAPAVAPATFRPLFESQSTAAAVIRELGLDKSPDFVTPSAFVSNVISVEEIHGTSLIQLTAADRDPARAAAIAQRVAEKVVDLARKVGLSEQKQGREFIKEQLDVTETRLHKAQAELTSYRDTAQIEALKKDIDATLLERSKILALVVEIEAQKAKLAKAEQELAARFRIDTLTKIVDSDSEVGGAVRDRLPPGASATGLQMKSESISQVFERLDGEVATTRANLAALEKQKSQLVEVRKIDAGRLPQLAQLYEREGTLKRLEMERDLAEKLYIDVAARYEGARLQIGGRSAQLEIIDPATSSDRPLSRNVARNTALAGMTGLSLAALAAMFLHVLRLANRRGLDRRTS